ncbi:hypothetical protein [Streptomyces subrutilus]|uniref:hypothetical protein n=1 Tax=Streptomyces subrutilus TaxID=36818 RepID=UPI002E11070E|nr:hypothetical protein OG479_29560 [Streptomyces subrutilus]
MTTAIPDPLHDPQRDARRWVPSLDIALQSARATLADTAPADIHDHTDMVKAAAGLDYALRSLVAALDAEASR